MNILYMATYVLVSCIQDTFSLTRKLNLSADFANVGAKAFSIGTSLVTELSAATAESWPTDNKDANKPTGDKSLIRNLNSASIDSSTFHISSNLISQLTAPCRYNRLERPLSFENGSVSNAPVKIHVRIYNYILQNVESSDLEFKAHGIIQIRFNDPRLQFAKYAPNRTQSIIGETSLRDLIWVPHIQLANEPNSNIVGANDKGLLTVINPDGTVVTSSRVAGTLYCWMKLQKFPFDEQFCPIVLDSWLYNTSELLLQWEHNEPVTFTPKVHLGRYTLNNVWTNETVINTQLAFAGNYSSLSFTTHLTRNVGYYVVYYFLPSIMIVAISWVSFWLQPDQTPARTTLGCSTLLSLITLASTQDSHFPKVSYIKISEVWFLGCTCFIFGGLVEFAFVNTIWRRKHKVKVKKINAKYILKSTLTPNTKPHQVFHNINCDSRLYWNNLCERYNSVVDSAATVTVDEVVSANTYKPTESDKSQLECRSEQDLTKYPTNNSWDRMSPQEVSLWIDKKARFIFPLAFIIFNAFFWTFVYCL